jgi:arylsulfatase A-like enzyme
MLGSHGHYSKQRPWEECINVPFMLRYPRAVTAGQRRDWIVSSVDVMPTLLGLCGISAPKAVQGLDLSATFCGHSQCPRQAAFLFNVDRGTGPGADWRGVRTQEWVYACHAQGDWVMYDLKNDPYELDNLVTRPEYGERKAELRQRLESMRKELGETLPLRGRLHKLPGNG